MELRQLAAFVAVAEHLNFGRAAEALGVNQPAISQAIRRLETSLDAVLFDRSSHHVTLTAAGSTLLPHARAAVEASARIRHLARELPAGRSGVLRVATTAGIGPRLGGVIRTYTAAHPEVALELPEVKSNHKLQALLTGRLDVAFMRSTPPPDPGLCHEVAWSERYVAIVPELHPAARAGPLDVGALADLPMLLVDRATAPDMHDQVLAACAAIGLRPRIGPSIRTVHDTIAIIAAGAAWSLYIEGNLPTGTPGVAVRSLPSPIPHSQISVVWRSLGVSPAAQAFVDTVLSAERSHTTEDNPQP